MRTVSSLFSWAWRSFVLNVDSIERSVYWAVGAAAITLAWAEVASFVIHRRKLKRLAVDSAPRDVLLEVRYASVGEEISASNEVKDVSVFTEGAREAVKDVFGVAKYARSYHDLAEDSSSGTRSERAESLAREALSKLLADSTRITEFDILLGFGILDVREADRREVTVVCVCESLNIQRLGTATLSKPETDFTDNDIAIILASAVSKLMT